jgi:hypothetical protein
MKESRVPGRFSLAAWLVAGLIGLIVLAAGATTRPGSEDDLLASAYSGGEYFRYDIAWLNAIKAGVLQMEIAPLAPERDRYRIRVTANSAGMLSLLYPVKDSFEIIVEGRDRLPVVMWQNDNRRGIRRRTEYNQKALRVSYSRENAPPEIYPVAGPVHNEFSSFLILRTLPILPGGKLMIPTYADRKRHEILIQIEGKEQRRCILGDRTTIKLQPQLTFQGLYQKVGNPVIWLTSDESRIPVRIEAKIKVGYLVAELAEYRRF